MNANELADKLNQFGEGAVFASIKLTDVATMLRQQQAELDRAVELYTYKAIENEAFEKEVKHWQDAFHKGVRT